MSNSLLKMKKELLELVENMNNGNFTYDGYHSAQRLNASYDKSTGVVSMELEVQGTQYEGRTDRIEYIKAGDSIKIIREPNNSYNEFNLAVLNNNNESLGNIGVEACEIISPLIDGGYLTIINSNVTHVEPLSKRGPRCKKALVYIKLEMELKSIEYSKENSCIICLLGGDQIRCWFQKLDIMKCDIPLETAKKIFELYNRYNNEYFSDDTSYLGLDNLVDEVSCAREKMKKEMKENLSYDTAIQKENFGEYIEEMCKAEPERYEGVLEYLKNQYEEAFFSIDEIFSEHVVEKETYYWVDQFRVTESEWDSESGFGFNHWYEVMELYSPDEPLPFDMEDEDIVSIFGFNKFEAFGDLSYGC